MKRHPRPHRRRFHYGFGKHTLKPEEVRILLEHGSYLAAHPGVVVHLHAHADRFGSIDYNLFLARLRARTARKLLRSAGARNDQVRATSWGCSKPLARPDDHAANRRLELVYQNEVTTEAL
ncbi:OmpA family protein [Marinobacter sp. X15-166B]|uniref:OmpA family protein n=1 Tax=Marinobacter sp. X15-166B TaxID=1897620 RepID=UPI001D172670|nr:OmpA family protein [Marinobacter sp. X15-166B]